MAGHKKEVGGCVYIFQRPKGLTEMKYNFSIIERIVKIKESDFKVHKGRKIFTISSDKDKVAVPKSKFYKYLILK